jgi:ElaB/YqjD/DUF883 family membrane-anchored ribosome-binding protein
MTKSIAQKIVREAEHAADEVVHDFSKARRQVAARTEDTLAAISEAASEARDRTQALAKTAVRTVRDRPVASVAIAAGLATIIGFIVGRFAPRKS